MLSWTTIIVAKTTKTRGVLRWSLSDALVNVTTPDREDTADPEADIELGLELDAELGPELGLGTTGQFVADTPVRFAI
jgi:hypothetical protein